MTPTVTLRRLAAWLAERGYSYDIDLSEGVVRSSVAGFDYVLMVVDRRILAVRAHHQLAGSVPGAAALSRVRAVAQEVSSGRLIPALYTEVDDAGLGLCAEVLTNIGAGLDDAQLAGTMDFVLDGVDEALREVLSILDVGTGSGPDNRSDAEAPGEAGREAAPDVVAPYEDEGARDVTPGEGARPAEPSPRPAAPAGADSPARATDPMRDATLEMAAVIDGPGTDAHAQSPARAHAEPAADVKSDESMTASGDADGGTGVETTNTPKPLLVS
ncbi:hypothetical protein [Actinomyces viscosus]|uniref:hypothetical protein n=1 Tax=Actinomyces viscosus TaxID=1656 RepID=UPI0028F149F0|nr:hypothetical protein [Actinomyces viscosus]